MIVRPLKGIERSVRNASFSDCTTGGKTDEQSSLVVAASQTMAVAESTVRSSGSGHEQGVEQSDEKAVDGWKWKTVRWKMEEENE
jgi:hypothetical protein